MFIYVFLIIFMLLFIVQYGNKKGFNKLETYWICLTLIFYTILFNLNPTHRIILLLITYKTKCLLIPICTITGILFTILGQKFKTYRLVCSYVYKHGLNLKMNTESIPLKPTIYVANYPCNYVEYLVHGLFCDKFCLLVYGPAIKVLKHLYGMDHLISVEKGSFDKVQENIKDKINKGYSIFSYVERDFNNRKSPYELCELRKGVFTIAKNLNTTITPVCIDHIEHTFGIFENNIFRVQLGDTRIVEDPDITLKETEIFLKKELKKFSIPSRMKI